MNELTNWDTDTLHTWIQSFKTGTQQDPWLAEELEELLELPLPWRIGVAVGLTARFQPVQKQSTRALLAFLQQKSETPPPLSNWEQWLKERKDDQLDELLSQARAKMSSMMYLLDELEEAHEQPVEEWLESCYDLIVQRDNLACVTLLLQRRDRLRELRFDLENVDARGQRLLLSLPVAESLQSEHRIQRIFAQEPDAWWCKLTWAAPAPEALFETMNTGGPAKPPVPPRQQAASESKGTLLQFPSTQTKEPETNFSLAADSPGLSLTEDNTTPRLVSRNQRWEASVETPATPTEESMVTLAFLVDGDLVFSPLQVQAGDQTWETDEMGVLSVPLATFETWKERSAREDSPLLAVVLEGEPDPGDLH
jgi:hypothetical protein